MNKLTAILSVSLLTLMGLFITSCSDDEPANIDTETSASVDELEYLQNNLVILDENGGIKERVYGRVLDESTPETVYIGVENYDEAKEIFAILFSDDTEISDDSSHARFTSRQGNAELVKGNGDEGLVAKATFDIDGLKHVNSIRFILNSAWPENYDQDIVHEMGEQYQFNAWDIAPRDHTHYEKYKSSLKSDGLSQTFVCIRESKNGVPALLVGVSNKPHSTGNHPYGYYVNVSKKQFNEIHAILSSNWTYFKAAFNSDGNTILDEKAEFWVDDGFWCKVGNFYTGKIRKRDNTNSHRLPFYMTKDR